MNPTPRNAEDSNRSRRESEPGEPRWACMRLIHLSGIPAPAPGTEFQRSSMKPFALSKGVDPLIGSLSRMLKHNSVHVDASRTILIRKSSSRGLSDSFSISLRRRALLRIRCDKRYHWRIETLPCGLPSRFKNSGILRVQALLDQLFLGLLIRDALPAALLLSLCAFLLLLWLLC